MIVVKVELWPEGDRTHPRPLGTLEIGNVGGTLAFGQYECKLTRPSGKVETVSIGGWRRSQDAWALVGWVLAKLAPVDPRTSGEAPVEGRDGYEPWPWGQT